MIANTNNRKARLLVAGELLSWCAIFAGHLVIGFYVTVAPYTCGDINGGCPRIAGFNLLQSIASFPMSALGATVPAIAQIDLVNSDLFWPLVIVHSAAAASIMFFLGGVFFRATRLALKASRRYLS